MIALTEFSTEIKNIGFRAGGLIMEGEKLLLHTSNIDDFYVIPGCGIQLYETSDQALKREFREEIGVDITIERLLWVLENLFEYDNERHHGMELIYLVSPLNSADKLKQDEFYGVEKEESWVKKYGEITLIFRWFLPSELDDIVIKPDILKEELKNIPSTPKHIQIIELDK